MSSIPLPLQTGLDHRGGPGADVASLFPPAGTFEAIGGRAAVARLVDGLYDRFEADPVLRPAFGRDLMVEREKVKRFFEDWFGGVSDYFNGTWPHSLAAAHGGISISRGMAARWIGHFLASFGEAVPDQEIAHRIRPLIVRLAMGFVNRDNEPVPGERLRCSTKGTDPLLLQSVQRDDAPGLAAVLTAHPPAMWRQGPRLLLVAAVRGKARAAAELLRLGVDPNAPAALPGSEASVQGLPLLPMTPLCGALARRRDAVVKLLVDHGAQYDIFTAVVAGDLAAVGELLDRVPELVNAGDPAGDVGQITPLLHAVAAGQRGVAQLLLERGATVQPNSVRLVRAAAELGDEALLDQLLEHGAEAAGIGPGDWVMHPAMAGKLLARGADVNLPPGRWIGLCCTGNSGHKENVALAQGMLRCGADVKARYKGSTALHCAAKAGFVHVVEALIEYGADVNAENDRGSTPLDELEHAARSIDREPVQRVLIAHGARRSGS